MDEIESYKINHVTCYSLDEFLNNDMTNEIEYEYIIGLLKNRGYSQYDLINFSKNYSKGIHNSNYWKRGEYYAVGAGAH
ncbi:hypothetical protein IR145_16265, partial [Streptococcus danieliae]|nr:hypothetical protein [Streptococcus danieliae]